MGYRQERHPDVVPLLPNQNPDTSSLITANPCLLCALLLSSVGAM